MDEFVEEVLIEYVKEQHLDRTKNAGIVISNFCSNQPPLSITVYRGHDNTPVIRPGLWYSASTDINIATHEFAGTNCCVFIIHLHDVPCIDINHFIGDKIGDKQDEKEIIFLGGGTFYKNNELTEEGYLELGMGELNKSTFECWYSLSKLQHITQPKPKIQAVINNVERVLNIINPEEYDFITSIDDITGFDNDELSNEEKLQVFNEIKKRKVKGGEKIKTHKNTQKKRSKSKRIRSKRSKSKRSNSKRSNSKRSNSKRSNSKRSKSKRSKS